MKNLTIISHSFEYIQYFNTDHLIFLPHLFYSLFTIIIWQPILQLYGFWSLLAAFLLLFHLSFFI